MIFNFIGFGIYEVSGSILIIMDENGEVIMFKIECLEGDDFELEF